MSLRRKESISNSYNIKAKKSTYFSRRIDLFLVICLVVLVTAPIIYNLVSELKAKIKQIDLYISADFEVFFGKEMTETLLQEFQEHHHDIRIKLANIVDEKTGALAREPDIFIFDKSDFNSLAAAGLLLPLEAGDDAETAPQLAVPLVSFMDLLFYNIELLQAAGFDRPPKTREEFLAYARVVSNGNNEALANASGFAVGLSAKDKQALSRDIFSWIWAAGNDPVINSRPFIRDLSFLGSLNREKLLAPGSFEKTGEQRLEEFAKGEIAMIIASSRAIPALREKMGSGTFGITTIPVSAAAGKYSIVLSGIYAGINSNCAHPEAAMLFFEYLVKQNHLFCAQLKAVPGDASDFYSSDYNDYMKDDPFYSKAWEIFESSLIVDGFSGTAKGDEYEEIFREELQIFFEGNSLPESRTAEATAAAIQRRWNEVGD